jgi:homoserine kinase
MPGRYRVRVPASTANLGPGFDVIGCALNLFLELEATVLEDQQNTVMVQYEGVSADMVPLDRSNLVVQSMIHLVYRMQQGQRTSG